MSAITVIAKIAGYHPATGLHLVKGEEYTIDENAFSAQLFERPFPGWLAPWEYGASEIPVGNTDLLPGEQLVDAQKNKETSFDMTDLRLGEQSLGPQETKGTLIK